MHQGGARNNYPRARRLTRESMVRVRVNSSGAVYPMHVYTSRASSCIVLLKMHLACTYILLRTPSKNNVRECMHKMHLTACKEKKRKKVRDARKKMYMRHFFSPARSTDAKGVVERPPAAAGILSFILPFPKPSSCLCRAFLPSILFSCTLLRCSACVYAHALFFLRENRVILNISLKRINWRSH